MSQQILKGVLTDHGLFYLGTIVDSVRSRGVGDDGFIVAPQFIRHVIYMEDTNFLLANHNGECPTNETLAFKAKNEINKDWDVKFHELSKVVHGLCIGCIDYIDLMKLPLIEENGSVISDLFNEFQDGVEDCHATLVDRMHSESKEDWMPLDYRWLQMLVFARTKKIEVNYSTALGHLQGQEDFQIYDSAMSDVKHARLVAKLTDIELNARRGIL